MREEMENVVCQLIWLAVYGYYAQRIGTLQKGAGRRAVLYGLAACCLVLTRFWLPRGIAWAFLILLFLLFDLFFDEERFSEQWWRILLPGMSFLLAATVPGSSFFVANGLLSCLLFLLLAQKRGYLGGKNALMVSAVFGLLTAFLWLFSGEAAAGLSKEVQRAVLWGGTGLELLFLGALEGNLASYQSSYEHKTEQFQKDVLSQQYAEIKSIYLDMRGWRHDYHNHLQVLKAQLALEDRDEMRRYLDELERDLNQVDTYVKSGNLTVDAILNSKLSLAKDRQIPFSCTAQLKDRLSIEDVDLCVILGNLLDNAMEACMQIEAKKRFLRVYMAINKEQLYLSVQNAAKEELNFNEKNYISTKRGNHGLGMKRVKAMVDKYNGFLRLANEPGIFAAEVTMPL